MRYACPIMHTSAQLLNDRVSFIRSFIHSSEPGTLSLSQSCSFPSLLSHRGNRNPAAALFGPPLPLLPLPPATAAAVVGGPLRMRSARPRSFQAGSRARCVAFWMPKAACWSGTTSSSSSGLMGWWCGGT